MVNPFRLGPGPSERVIKAVSEGFSKGFMRALNPGLAAYQREAKAASEVLAATVRQSRISQAYEVLDGIKLPEGKTLQYYDPNYTMWLEHECNICPEQCAFCGDIAIWDYKPSYKEEWRQFWHEDWRLVVGISAPILVTGSGIATYCIAR